MGFPASFEPQGYVIPTPPANGNDPTLGAGSLVNEYTVIMDVLYTKGNDLRPLLEMDDGSEDNIKALWNIAPDGSLQVTNTAGGSTLPSGGYGSLTTNVWYRLGLVFDEAAGTATVYTNGTIVGILNIGSGQLDSPFALLPESLLPVFSSSFTNAPGYVNSIQIRDSVLNPGQMEALGDLRRQKFRFICLRGTLILSPAVRMLARSVIVLSQPSKLSLIRVQLPLIPVRLPCFSMASPLVRL
jgi:hypothetical protein